ncbi:MAG: hypothetical protein MK213_10180 [Planctomycetes bacterium]|nr:hypothetical protein [Planctomycetota bacterium]
MFLPFLLLLSPSCVVAIGNKPEVGEEETEETYELHEEEASLEAEEPNTDLLAELQKELSAREDRRAVQEAEEAVEDARRELEHFMSHDKEEQIRSAKRDLLSTEQGILETEQELQQLRVLYQDAEFAKETGELVIQRVEHRLGQQRESFQSDIRAFEILKEYELPTEERDLHRALRTAEMDLADLRLQLQIQALENE